MIKPPWIKWSPKDALDGTMQLEAWEELAYRRILDMIYSSGDDVRDNDKTMRNATKTGARWLAIKAELIRLKKIEIVDGRISNPRCRETLQECDRFFTQKGVAGLASAEKRKSLKNNETAPTVVGTRVPTREPTNKKIDKEDSSNEESPYIPTQNFDQFEAWWSAYPSGRKGGKPKCIEKYQRIVKSGAATHEQLLAGAKRYADAGYNGSKFVKGPLVWLNGGHWTDEDIPPPGDAPLFGKDNHDAAIPPSNRTRTGGYRVATDDERRDILAKTFADVLDAE